MTLLFDFVQRDANSAPQALTAFRPHGNSPSVRHLTREILLCKRNFSLSEAVGPKRFFTEKYFVTGEAKKFAEIFSPTAARI